MELESENLSQRSSRAESQLHRIWTAHMRLSVDPSISLFARRRPAGASKSLLLIVTHS